MMGVSLRRGVDDGGEGGRRPPWAFWVFLAPVAFGYLADETAEGREKVVGQRAFYHREEPGEGAP